MDVPVDRRRFIVQLTGAAVGAAACRGGSAAGGAQSPRGRLTGRFQFDGPAPERKKLTVDKDVDCCGKFDIRDESLMVSDSGGLANVYVYLRSRDAAIDPALAAGWPERVTLDNLDCIFQPHCLAIWFDKQVLAIVNSDPVAQNVAFAPLQDTAANIVLQVGQEASWTFKRSQAVPVDGLPPGTWEFQAWHERTGYLTTPQWPKGRFRVEVGSDTSDLGTIVLAPALFDKK
ncbi:MAG: hypothetical protein MUF48_07460 [Pirellulaceae bacterium]|nr:hypothetical protein [Pirellulaceae bacterium]